MTAAPRRPHRPLPGRSASRLALIQHLFDASAQRYEVDIAPVLAPLTTDFAATIVRTLEPHRVETALDLGTGTGLLARALAPWARRVIGLDVSEASLQVARNTPAPAHVQFVRADIHDLPLPAGGAALIAASLGLNATVPHDSLRAIRRALAPGGRLFIQEWGPLPQIDRAFSEVFEDHLSEERGSPLRSCFDRHRPDWTDQLQDPDDYRELLAQLGFVVDQAEEVAPVSVRLPGLDDYLRYKLAWTHRWEEYRAMTGSARADFQRAVSARLASFAAPDGTVLWQPWVIRVAARKRST